MAHHLDYLDLSSKSLILFGSFNIILAVTVPVLSHLLFPKPFLFVSEDEQFARVSWFQILDLNSRLGFWINLLMDTGRGGMMSFGVLTIIVASKPLRNGEAWALKALLVSGVLGGVYFWVPTSLYFREGLYNGISGVSLGIWTTLLLYLPWSIGLFLGWRGIRDKSKPEKSES